MPRAPALTSELDQAPTHLASPSYRTARRLLVSLAGSSLLLAGATLLFLPGPGLVTLLAGLALLATEFPWARIWLTRLRQKLTVVKTRARSRQA